MPNATFFARCAAALLTALSLLPTRASAQQLDPTFHPPHFALATAPGTPSVEKVLRQADGRYVVQGRFQSVDGHVTAGLARLLPTGLVDTTFTYRPAPLVNSRNALRLVAAQPDGKVVINGETATGEGTIVRLLPSGQLDSTFQPALPPQAASLVSQLIAQPDGKLLLGGTVGDSAGYFVRSGIIRLLADGQLDASFIRPVLPQTDLTCMLLEPDGRILYASGPWYFSRAGSQMGRLLASGRPDSSFTYPQQSEIRISTLARCPDGSYAVGGSFLLANGRPTTGHLLNTGAWDASYPFSLYEAGGIWFVSNASFYLRAIAVQSDGRILAGGYMYSVPLADDAGLVRAQLQGGDDASFDAAFIYTYSALNYPPYSTNRAVVNDLLVEPGGKCLVAGMFNRAGGVSHFGLARLLPAVPLATSAPRNATPLEVWPVPAHGELHVQLPTSQAAQQVELLDATGRRVLTQPARTAALTLNTATLPAGLYVLRVRYADGTAATRRVVLE